MFCSHCGAKIPDNSKFCMACGEKIPQIEEMQNITVQQQAAEAHEEIEYTFHGQKLVLGAEFQEFVDGRNAFVDEFYSYIENENSRLRQTLEKPLEKNTYLDLFSNYGETALKWGINRAVQILIGSKVYDISDKQLIEAASERTQHFNERYCDFEEKYISIVGNEAELEEYRRLRRASRGRWVGGGFGIKGALKGAAKASLLNAGSRLIGMIGDGISDTISSAIASHEVAKLIKSRDWVLIYTAALSQDMAEIYEQMYLLLCERTSHTMPQFDREKSEIYLKNAQQVNSNDEFAQIILMSIKYNPFATSPYTELQKRFGDFDIETLNLSEQFLSSRNLDGIIFVTHGRFMNMLSRMPQNSYSEIDAKLRLLDKHFDELDQARYVSQLAENYCSRFQDTEYKIYNELSELRKTSDDGRHFSSAKELDQYLRERDKVSECISSLSQVESDVAKQEILTKLKNEIKTPILQDDINRNLQEVSKNIELVANADQKIKDAKALLRNKQYDDGIKTLELLARHGHIAAQLELGNYYAPRFAVDLEESRYMKAINWFQKAAEVDNLEACYRLCTIYKHHVKNEEKAFEWGDKAVQLGLERAAIGDVDAFYWLGRAHSEGCGVEKNVSKAIEWYQKGAETGDPVTQYELADLYYKIGTKEKDNAKLKRAFEWATKASEQGQIEAVDLLGLLYEFGRGVPKDHKKAMSLFKQAADLGNWLAEYHLKNYKRFWE